MFDDRDRHARTPAHDLALSCLEAGIEATRPDRLVADAVSLADDVLRIGDVTYDLSEFDRLLVLGGGKAAGGLAAELDAALGHRIDGGLIVTTAGSTTAAGRVDFVSGTHPVPTDGNVDATEALLSRARSADATTLVLAIVTGGASALLTAPAADLDVGDLADVTDALLESGASIDELNVVRKHCSAIKGGRLARAAAPASVVTLAISDVVGDDPAVIGSGPTVPDPSTFEDARAVLERYDLVERVPAVLAHLEAGAAGRLDETPTADDPAFDGTDWHLLGSGRTAIEAARDATDGWDFETVVLSSQIEGNAAEAGRFHAAVAAEIEAYGDPVEPPAVLVSGGEVTVTVSGDGIGGPNQELALSAAIDLAQSGTNAVLAGVDTDGVDGPTDTAGAIVDAKVAAGRVSEARDALAHNDAGTFLDERDALLRTGPTGTNVNDLRVVVIEAADYRSPAPGPSG